MKVCKHCGSDDITPGNVRSRTWRCRKCDAEGRVEWRKKNLEKDKETKTAYNASPRGVACYLRARTAMTKELSERWAAILLNQGSRCAICGLPNYVIKTYRERGWPFFLGKRFGPGSHPRLTLDHVVPGDNDGGFRPLCFACNSMRGAAQYSDEEVLTEVRSKWQWFTTPRFLYWLNSTPGVGGRLHRSVRCQKRDAQYAGGASPQPDPSTITTTTASPSDLVSATSAS